MIQEKLQQDKSLIIFILASIFGLGLVAHGYCYLNSMFSVDSIVVLYQYDDIFWKISLGRFVQPILMAFRGLIAMPWLIGLLSLLYLSIAAYFTVKLLDIKNRYIIFSICGILTTNLTLSATNATFIYESDMFMLSLALSVIGVYILRNYKKGLFWAIIPLVLSLGLYQAYIQVSIAMVMILFIKDILDKKPNSELWRNLGKAVISLLLSVALYIIIHKLVLFITGISVSNSTNSIKLDNISFKSYKFIHLFSFCFKKLMPIYDMIKGGQIIIASTLSIIFFTLTSISFINLVKHLKINRINRIYIIVTIILMPIFINIINFVIYPDAYTLTIFSTFFIIILFLMIFEYHQYLNISLLKLKNKWFNRIVFISIGAMIFGNIILANQLYLKKELEYQSTLSFTSRLIDRIEQHENYVTGETKVALIGFWAKSPTLGLREGFDKIVLRGSNTTQYSITFKAEKYFKYILGYNMNILKKSEMSDKLIIEGNKLPSFPDKNSMKYIDGILVVKIGDISDTDDIRAWW
ncbi:MAG: glucosyltransferase domain-containing protein [Rikenellaceae bacterium]